jgi:CheY-like chemotaxis protein
MMTIPHKPIVILVADDDEDDRWLMQEALQENQLATEIRFVVDGEDLMDYLYQRNQYANCDPNPPDPNSPNTNPPDPNLPSANPTLAPRPSLILLDLNMPRKDGREALKEIKADPLLRQIPVVILTTSQAEEDISKTYDLGVSSYITKPVTFEAMVDILKTLSKYWFEIVALPDQVSSSSPLN